MVEEHLKQIKGEVDEIDKRIGWNSLYQTIRTESIAHDFPCAAAKSANNKGLNRYRDVSPFDHSRVVLSKGSSDYINASLVQVSRAGRRYILTQGPLPHTAGHFWLMIWEQNSKAILMLNKVIEKNQIKCHQYWPLGENQRGVDVMEFHDVDLRVRFLSEEQSRNFVVRTLRIEDMNTSESREVLQFHYTTWPDFGVPSTPRSFLHFLQVVRDSGVLNANVGPPVVHCSAGIGRSGTFCLVDSCLLMMEEGLVVNIKDVLMDMRKFRMGLIQTADQLQFSYLAIQEGLQQLSDGKRRFLSDENENGDVIEVDEKPSPPKRIDSLPSTVTVHEELYRRLIQSRGMELEDRPLPDIPTSSSSEEDSSEDSMIDDEIDDDTADKSESSKEEPISAAVESQVTTTTTTNNTEYSSKDEEQEITVNSNSTEIKTNGVSTTSEEAALRRRAKNEALREKIKEIKTHQKESEAVQGFYRLLPDKKYLLFFIASVSVAFAAYYLKSPKPKRRKESKDDEEDNTDGSNREGEMCEESGGDVDGSCLEDSDNIELGSVNNSQLDNKATDDDDVGDRTTK